MATIQKALSLPKVAFGPLGFILTLIFPAIGLLMGARLENVDLERAPQSA